MIEVKDRAPRGNKDETAGGKAHRHKVRLPSGPSAQGGVPRAALGTSISSIREADGRVSGLKFNILAMELYWKLSKAENKAFHFVLPYRWYLYGAVVDGYMLRDCIKFDHPDNELGTNVEAVSAGLFDMRSAPAGLREEIEPFTWDLARKHAGQAGIPGMLRDHYRMVPLPFQRDFLEWSQLTRAMLFGYEPDDSRTVALHFNRLVKSYPQELEPRLTSAFGRLALCLEPIVTGRTTGDLGKLREAVTALWDFWTAFCLFLSVRYNEGLPDARLKSYRAHAETELPAYKRRLSAYLENGYLQEGFIATRLGQDIAPLSRFMVEKARLTLEKGCHQSPDL
ncbi:MAG: hypothetical protein FJ149_09185 [Euryarchaeota archaeon]|nr:hypothetical protein [Euryarchaeota archaeon]